MWGVDFYILPMPAFLIGFAYDEDCSVEGMNSFEIFLGLVSIGIYAERKEAKNDKR